jgi:hypothetical protein
VTVWRRAAAALALVGAIAACSGGGSSVDEGPPIRGVEKVRVESAKHTNGRVAYDRHPPAGGDHNPQAAPCGFYTESIPDEYVVHTLEHGAVWLAYPTTASAEDLAAVRAVVDGNADTIATPYPDLDAGVAVVVTAWARQLRLTSVTDPRLAEFVARYQNGDQAPEASIPCPRLRDGAG